MTERPDRITLAAFGAAVLIGGTNFVAVRFSNRELDPIFGAGLRFTAAALLLVGYVVLRRIPFPRGRVLVATLGYGFLSFSVTYALVYWALDSLSAGIAAVVFGATPLVTVLLAAAHGLERITRRALLGSSAAIVGIVILADPFSASGVPGLPLLAILGATVAAAEATVIIKAVPPEHPVATNGVAMALGATTLVALSAITGDDWVVPTRAVTWTALVYLAVIGSIALFGLILLTLARWTATGSAYMTVLFPIVAMIGGALALDEAITWNGVVGGVVVISAVYLGALRAPSPVARRPSPVSPPEGGRAGEAGRGEASRAKPLPDEA